MSGLAVASGVLDATMLLIPGAVLFKGVAMRGLAAMTIRVGGIRTLQGAALDLATREAAAAFEASAARAPAAMARAYAEGLPVTFLGSIAEARLDPRDFVPIWGTKRAIDSAKAACNGN